MPKLPIIHATRDVTNSHFLQVEQLDLEFANGVRRTYERLKGCGLGAVIIVPMRDDETVLLVREYAGGLGRYELGLPKGRQIGRAACRERVGQYVLQPVLDVPLKKHTTLIRVTLVQNK